jgi:hypothetical protein
MLTLKRLLFLSLALALSFILVACNGGMPQGEMDQIIASAIAAQFDTVRVEADMTMTMEVVGGPDAGVMNLVLDFSGVADLANGEMQGEVNITADIPLMDEEDMSAEFYLVDGWMYVQTNIFGMGEQWLKMEAGEDIWPQDLISAHQEFLQSAVDINYLRTETLNGVECYVFEIVPDIEALSQLSPEDIADMAFTGFDPSEMADLLEGLSVMEWIAVDSSLPMRVEVYLNMAMNPGDVGATAEDFGSATIVLAMVVNFYDYNKPVSIELPPEALGAEEIPYY